MIGIVDRPTGEISPRVTWTGSASEKDYQLYVEQNLREGVCIGLQAQSSPAEGMGNWT